MVLQSSVATIANDGSRKVLFGLVYLDFVDFLEKIGDHFTNIAQGPLSGLRWESR